MASRRSDSHSYHHLAQVCDAYRLRWQVELLFKEWKPYANLHAFDTSNPNIAEGLLWGALCAAILKRYCAPMLSAADAAGLQVSWTLCPYGWPCAWRQRLADPRLAHQA